MMLISVVNSYTQISIEVGNGFNLTWFLDTKKI